MTELAVPHAIARSVLGTGPPPRFVDSRIPRPIEAGCVLHQFDPRAVRIGQEDDVYGVFRRGARALDDCAAEAHQPLGGGVEIVNGERQVRQSQLVAAGGSVDGTWTNYTITGSGIVYLNGDPQIGVNPAQLVVEGFTLPAGTTIGANGQLILPQGVLLGLLSPGGGKPKMILVHTVQELGQLLADGYSVIVIDLSGKDKDKPIQLASN